ncbi:glycosyltransferase [Neorhizobium sp. Rsf11]|uniref:Glycosyltransferase n=1 Tax=Neorhizobium phenanthreniclasticum TaxID=3157917 RepID=A0ABV0M684_9HYPH
MKVAVFTTCPKSAFSGGRYHAMMIAHVLARRGHQVYFITNNRPIFADDLAPISDGNPVNIVLTDNDFDILPDSRFDAVFIAPQMSFLPRFYRNAIRFARHAKAALFLINYESPNWFNACSPTKRPEERWKEWRHVAQEGACIICSANESEKFAREYYRDLPPESDFAIWQPAINSVACATVPAQVRQKFVMLFSRPSDKHKGGGDIKDLIGPELRGYKVGIVIGDPQQSDVFLHELRQHAEQFDVQIEPFFGISDRQKFLLLKRAAAVVFPSYFEGYGYPPIEALAADTPCVAYDLPVVRENCGELIRYAPVGDVTALRDKLAKALEAGPVRTSDDARVVYLTDVDQRGAALEKVVSTYLETRLINQRIKDDDLSVGFGLSAASAIKVNSQLHLIFTVSSKLRLAQVTSSSNQIVSVQFHEQGWAQEGWRYAFFIKLISEASPEEISKCVLDIEMQDTNVTVKLSLANLRINQKKVPWFSEKKYRLKRALRTGNCAILSGWVYPEKAYDALYLMDKKGVVVSLYTALKDEGYKGLFASTHPGNYGFMSSTIDTAAFDVSSMRLLVLREGVIVGKGRFTANAVLSSAKPLQILRDGATISGKAHIECQAITKQALEGRQGLQRVMQTSGEPLKIRSSPYVSPLVEASARLPMLIAAVGKGWPKIRELWAKAPSVVEAADALKLAGPKWAVSECSYSEHTGELLVRGWISSPDNIQIEIWRGDMTMMGIAQNGYPRPDVAKEMKSLTRDDFGFAFSAPYDGELDDGIMLRLFQDGRFLAQKLVKSIKIKRSENFKVDDCLFDPTWRILWMRGTFRTSGENLEKLEVMRNSALIGTAAIDERLLPGGVRFFRWRVESVVIDKVSAGDELILRTHLSDGSVGKTKYTVKDNKDWVEAISVPDEYFQFSVTGDGLNMLRSMLTGAPLQSGCQQIILLIIHNLNALERGEKRVALEQLRRELNKAGADLVLLHHSKVSAGCKIPEINFFDPSFGDITERLGLKSQSQSIDGEALNYIQRMLHGFSFALNRRPKPWTEIEEQIREEHLKVETVVKLLKPSMVLLWHQWNSLMLLGRAVSDRYGIPSAVIHEGMIPGTMTIDAHGMMAESDSTGIMLDPSDANNERYFRQARHVIAAISANRLDRKPHAGTPAASQIIETLRRKKAKIVFYAGVNDWQSGNLPADHPRAKIHSPYYRDTLEGLEALLQTAERLDFFVVYKPHPNLFPRPLDIYHERLVYVREANATDCIEATDVTVTLLSSLAYISLAHRVPTVLLGRNTLSGVHAAYELDDYDSLDLCIRDALDKKDHEHRIVRYERHLAGLLERDLFPYGEKTDFSLLTYQNAIEKLFGIMEGFNEKSTT